MTSHNSFTENHAAAAKYGPERERESVVKARQGPQPFSSPTIFGDDVIIHKKKKNVSAPKAQLEQE